jgi:hypothetical protein
LLLQVVADRVLLARLVLLREELRLRAEQVEAQQQFFTTTAGTSDVSDGTLRPQGDNSESATQGQNAPRTSAAGNRFFAFHRSNLPARCAAFMKELLMVPERDRRLGLISKVSNYVTMMYPLYAIFLSRRRWLWHLVGYKLMLRVAVRQHF